MRPEMVRSFLSVLGATVVSALASTLLGQFALLVTPFGHMVREMRTTTQSAPTANPKACQRIILKRLTTWHASMLWY